MEAPSTKTLSALNIQEISIKMDGNQIIPTLDKCYKFNRMKIIHTKTETILDTFYLIMTREPYKRKIYNPLSVKIYNPDSTDEIIPEELVFQNNNGKIILTIIPTEALIISFFDQKYENCKIKDSKHLIQEIKKNWLAYYNIFINTDTEQIDSDEEL